MTQQPTIKAPKKLIEVALPLDAINAAAAREKSIRHGHPSTMHLWWARRPLAAARAVIFGQMVNDPSWKWELEHPGEAPPSNLKASWAASRKRLFAIIEDLVKWENTTNEEVLGKARAEIRKSWAETCEVNKDHPHAAELFNPDELPAFHDPFAGGGSLPLEAQRLGLATYATDLNPVSVLINKAMIEIPPKFAGVSPVNPEYRRSPALVEQMWPGARGLAEDLRYYGRWMRDEAFRRIGTLYPPVEITAGMAEGRSDLIPLIGKRLTVIAWLWARTVKSPNPAFTQIAVPLVSTFVLSNREGNEAYVEPIVESDGYRFTVRTGPENQPESAKNGTKASRGSFRCLMSGAAISAEYVRAEAQAGRMGARLMAVVVEGDRGRVFLPPTPEVESVASGATPAWKPDIEFFQQALGFRVGNYGMTKWSDIFSGRQLVALTTFCDLVHEVRDKVRSDAVAVGMLEGQSLAGGGKDAVAYADAVSVYCALATSKAADLASTICHWQPNPDHLKIAPVFSRHALPMSWDYAEGNPFSTSSGHFYRQWELVSEGLESLGVGRPGHVCQMDATSVSDAARCRIISTDPPYFDNIGYADLSDFFYVWLRRALKGTYPELFATVVTPKAEELVATPDRHGGSAGAEAFFMSGMTRAMHRIREEAHPAFPVTIYYAFKQSEEGESGIASTGWVTFLEALLNAGFSTSGTWPMRTERQGRMRDNGSNALASSVILVCRPRSADATSESRRAFLRELNQVLPTALLEMTTGAGDERAPVAPVDLSQAIIGPGMAVFSKYAAVLEADGKPMSVRMALQLINRFFAEDDFDHDTQFCLHWFEQHGWAGGKFGDADTLARAKGTSVDGAKHAGVIFSAGGVVRLRKWLEYPSDWDPKTDSRLPIWEALHHLIRVFKSEGESGTGKVLAAIENKAEAMRQLAYRLYTLCERAGWAEDARAYNEIITSWSAIESAAAASPVHKQTTMFG